MLSVSTGRERSDYARRFKQAQRQRMQDAADRGFAVSQEEVPLDRGTLQQSGVPPTWTSDGELVWGYNADHAWPMEDGTEPYHPPLEPLLEWSERVTGGKGLGYYVATQKIPEEGVDGHGYAAAGVEAQRRYYRSHSLSEYLDRTD